MNKIRSEYITCIVDQQTKGRSLCGRDIGNEFHFENIDHAFLNAKNEGRLVACPDCLKQVSKVLFGE